LSLLKVGLACASGGGFDERCHAYAIRAGGVGEKSLRDEFAVAPFVAPVGEAPFSDEVPSARSGI
jgi:hypothetical protein